MGWKSTITLDRDIALSILSSLDLDSLSNEQLGDMLDPIGDDPGSYYFGHNFQVTGKEPDNDVSIDQ